MKRRVVIALCAVAWLGTARCRREARHAAVVLASPAVAATGLPQRLVSEFSRETGTPLSFRIVTREQIESASKSSTVVAIVREPDFETALARERLVQLKSMFAYEDFVVVGPRRDPAHVRRARSAADAFHRIAEHNRSFCSPVDVAPAHDVELEIWSAAAFDPHRDRRYKECHGTAAEVLDRCDSTDAYTIVDRGAAASNRRRHLEVLLEKTPLLHYEYVVLLLRPQGEIASRNESWFVEWVMSFRGREIVRGTRERGERPVYAPGER